MAALIGIVFTVLFTLGIFVLLFFLLGFQKKKIREQMSTLAHSLGMQVTMPKKQFLGMAFGFPSIQGLYHNRSLNIYSYTTGSGKHRQNWTAINIAVSNPQEIKLKVYKEGFFSKIGKAMGMKDIEVGDPDFDKNYIIKCSDEGFVKRLLNTQVKAVFNEIWIHRKPAGTIEVKGNQIVYTEANLITSAKKRERYEFATKLMVVIDETLQVH